MVRDMLGKALRLGDSVVFAPRVNAKQPHVRVGSITFMDTEDGSITIHYIVPQPKGLKHCYAERDAGSIVKVAA